VHSAAQEVVTAAARATAAGRVSGATAATAAVTVTIRNVAASRHRHHENNTVHRATSEKIGENNPHV
jgi:hypothetical protein